MSLTIRHAIASDRDRCLELLGVLREGAIHARAGEAFDRLMDRARGAIFVAGDEERLLGMASVSYNLAMRFGGEYCQLEELVVDPAARGMNLGGQLLQTVLRTARERGCAECGLYLIPTTVHNRPFYEKYGFRALDVEMRQAL